MRDLARPGWSRTALFYWFFFLAMGAHLPFWPLWLADWGLTEAEVGAYTAAAVAARVVFGAVIPWAADRAGAPRRALALISAASAALILAHEAIAPVVAGAEGAGAGRALLLLATLASAAAMAGIMPIADALSLRAAERGGFAYAPARAVGSFAFLVATLACGWAVARWGSDAALWWIVITLAPMIWLGYAHPGGAGAALPRPDFGEMAALMRARPFLLTMIAGASLQGSHAVLYSYGSIHWRGQGIDDQTIGALWAFGVALEVILMIFAGRWLIERLGAAGAMALSGAVGVLRWACMTLDPGLLWLWPLQGLHAITFTAAFLGALAMVRAIAPESLSSTAQGLAGATAGGVVMAGAGFAAAAAYPAFGAGAYWIGAALSLVGLVAALALRRRD